MSPGRVMVGGQQRIVDGPHELQILRLIDGPAQHREIGLGLVVRDAEALRSAIEELRDVLALEFQRGLGGCLPQAVGAHDLDVEAVREGRLVLVAADIGRVDPMMRNHRVDHVRIGERTIPGQPHDMFSRVLRESADEAAQHVVEAAAKDRDARRLDHAGELVVGPIRAGRDDEAVEKPCPANALDLAHDHRLACEIAQHLPGQPARRCPRLQHRDRAASILR